VAIHLFPKLHDDALELSELLTLLRLLLANRSPGPGRLNRFVGIGR
jgi:hypothetical protein